MIRLCRFTNPTNFKEKSNYFREHEDRVVDAIRVYSELNLTPIVSAEKSYPEIKRNQELLTV